MNLPVEQVLPEVVAALRPSNSTCAVLCAAPGAGKTTLVPPYLLKHLCSADGKILMLEPRRIAARAAAKRISFLLNSPPGGLAGYRTRLDTKISAATRIEVLTEGILTRMIQDDPELKGVEAVIFDEFHERSLHADLALALCLELKQALRPDLRILIMSATLDAERVSALLGRAPVIRSDGKMFPVQTVYRPRRDPRAPVESDVASVIREALRAAPGDLLVFLPGEGEIRRTEQLLFDLSSPEQVVLPLYGNLSAAEQNAAIEPDPAGRRRIILSTSIAETSLTIDGVRIVVDCGFMRVPRFSPRNGMNRLETVRVSRASADQRRGRAGRTAPGVCFRLWSEEEDARLAAFNTPEILESDPVPLVLELAGWGTRPADIPKLGWLDCPSESRIAGAVDLLQRLSALNEDGSITAHGRRLLRLPVHPRLGHSVLCSDRHGFGFTACALAAILSERDFLRSEESADLRIRLSAFSKGGTSGDRNLFGRIQESARQIARAAGIGATVVDPESAGLALAFAYPDRIGRSRSPKSGDYLLSNGTGGRLSASDPLTSSEYLAAGVVEGEGSRQKIYSAAPLALADLEEYAPDLFTETFEVSWNSTEKAVSAQSVRKLGLIPVREKPALSRVPAERVARMLLDGIRSEGIASLNFDESTAAFRARILFLRRTMGDDWPDLSDEGLLNSMDEWLLPFLDGCSKLTHLKKISMRTALELLLTRRQKQDLPRLAPERLEVPSGSFIRIHYASPDGIPVLAVRLQEIFGLLDTPRLADGRAPVAVEILSPAMRIVQRTMDLRHFWEESYFLVRKDMRGRYPKHNWPENPLEAEPSRRTTKKK